MSDLRYTATYHTPDGGQTFVRLDPIVDDPLTRIGPEVDRGHVFRRSPSVVWLEVDGEVVSYVPEHDISFVLDPLTGACWQCLDGVASVGDIVDDMVAVTGWDAADIEEQYVPVFRKWWALGVIEVVS
jgi:hypothetical protein